MVACGLVFLDLDLNLCVCALGSLLQPWNNVVQSGTCTGEKSEFVAVSRIQ